MICVTFFRVLKKECGIFNTHPNLFHEDVFSVFKLK